MQGSVISVKHSDKKQTLIIIELLVGDEKRKYTVSEGTYREIGCPLSAEQIDAGAIELLEEEHLRREAMKRALRILAYADNNSKTLYRKLILAGHSRECAAYAVRECVSLGYINEAQQLERLISLGCNRDLFGPSKIFSKLLAKGYAARDISAAMDRLRESKEIDFQRSKELLLMKKAPESYEEKQKILYKYGYKNETY